LERGDSSAVGRDRVDRPDNEQQHYYHHAPKVKPEAATAVVELLMMGVRTPETCSAVHKRQLINLRNYSFIWLIYLNCVMMNELENFKLNSSGLPTVREKCVFSASMKFTKHLIYITTYYQRMKKIT
jgi:hypothetical protein